jgi:vacuolar-type H+-ATPase subunit B/Vma2
MVSTFSSSPVPENRLAAQLALSSIVEGLKKNFYIITFEITLSYFIFSI